MGKIYAPPEEFKLPDISKYLDDFKGYIKACESYTNKIKAWVKKNYGSSCPEAGEVVSFPVADGAASYIIVTLKPVQLIHVDTYDGYQYPFINRLTASDIRKKYNQEKALRSIFSKPRTRNQDNT
jgi:hypothetical protein